MVPAANSMRNVRAIQHCHDLHVDSRGNTRHDGAMRQKFVATEYAADGKGKGDLQVIAPGVGA